MLYYGAFLELDTERRYENAPIPRSAIVAWAVEAGMVGDQYDDFIYTLLEVDTHYIDHRRKERKKLEDIEARKSRRGRRKSR